MFLSVASTKVNNNESSSDEKDFEILDCEESSDKEDQDPFVETEEYFAEEEEPPVAKNMVKNEKGSVDLITQKMSRLSTTM